MDKSNSLIWKESLTSTYHEIIEQIVQFAPQIIGAIALLIIGWIVAHIVRVITKKLVNGFDSIFKRSANADSAKQKKMKRSYAKIISKIMFWTVMMFFIAATANLLGWKMFSNWMTTVIEYLPNLISGLLIILAGFLLGNGARSFTVGAAHSAGMEQGELLARVVQMVIFFTTLIIGVEQIGINVDFLTHVLVVIIGVLLAGGALAFGLGGRTLVANIIGAQYVRKHCRIGEQMQIGDVEGSVVEVTQTSIILDTDYGRTIIPAKQFQENISSFKSEGESTEDIKLASIKKSAKKPTKKAVKKGSKK